MNPPNFYSTTSRLPAPVFTTFPDLPKEWSYEANYFLLCNGETSHDSVEHMVRDIFEFADKGNEAAEKLLFALVNGRPGAQVDAKLQQNGVQVINQFASEKSPTAFYILAKLELQKNFAERNTLIAKDYLVKASEGGNKNATLMLAQDALKNDDIPAYIEYSK